MARHSRRVVYPDTPEDPLDILTHRYSDEYHSTRFFMYNLWVSYRGYALEKTVWHSLEYYWGKDLGRGPC